MLFPEQKYEIVTFGKDCSSKKLKKQWRWSQSCNGKN